MTIPPVDLIAESALSSSILNVIWNPVNNDSFSFMQGLYLVQGFHNQWLF